MQNHYKSRDTDSVISDALPAVMNDDAFWPTEPRTLEEAGITEMTLEGILCQQLLHSGSLSGRNLSEKTGIAFAIIEQQISSMRMRQIVTHARPAPLNDFYYTLTEGGRGRAAGYQKHCDYSGPAPVPLMDYTLSVEAQATHFEPITESTLRAALANITYDPRWLDLLGPAINSTGGIFLFGPPGNGKTTLAKCLTACRGSEIWIPHAIIDDGHIIKLYDRAYHQPLRHGRSSTTLMAAQDYDRRWIRIQRPTVVVGGELTMESLELRHDSRSNTSEAPLQLKSNGGCLLIDDFGRQRIAPEELLNRWIVPLESRVDYLTLPTGKKITVPFEQSILFSTNLQPEQLVDEAFLRRVPFKIEITSPDRREFVEIFRRCCEGLNVPWQEEVVQQLIDQQYARTGRPLRRCHPRDLLSQFVAICAYRQMPLELRLDTLLLACHNYFGPSLLPGQGRAAPPPQPTPRAASAQPARPATQRPLASGGEPPRRPAAPAAKPIAAPAAAQPPHAAAPRPAEPRRVQANAALQGSAESISRTIPVQVPIVSVPPAPAHS